MRLNIWECLFCYVAWTQTRRTHDPYEKIGFGEGQKPYKNTGVQHILWFSISKNVDSVREYEKKIGLNNTKTYLDFAKRILNLREQTCGFIEDEIRDGKKIYVYGASTRGNTLLQYYGLNSELILAAAERNPEKWGKKTVGSKIPIISEKQARSEKPDYFLILPWYFKEEFVKRESEFLQNGGKFLIPLPEFEVINSDNL